MTILLVFYSESCFLCHMGSYQGRTATESMYRIGILQLQMGAMPTYTIPASSWASMLYERSMWSSPLIPVWKILTGHVCYWKILSLLVICYTAIDTHIDRRIEILTISQICHHCALEKQHLFRQNMSAANLDEHCWIYFLLQLEGGFFFSCRFIVPTSSQTCPS